MSRSEKKNLVSLPEAAEFDFRAIRGDELDNAIRYEYARSARWIVEPFERWQEQQVRVPAKGGRRPRTATVKELLEASLSAPLAADVEAILLASIPDQINEDPLHDVFLTCWVFPKPFLLLPGCVRRSGFVATLYEQTAYRVLEHEETVLLSEENARRLAEAGRYRIPPLEIKIGLGPAAVERDLALLIRKIYKRWAKAFPEQARAMKVPTGKRARTGKNAPWFRLRELAAYRLAREHHLSWHKAAKALETYRAAHPVGAHEDVWPNYASSGGWNDAVKSASRFLRELYPPPQD